MLESAPLRRGGQGSKSLRSRRGPARNSTNRLAIWYAKSFRPTRKKHTCALTCALQALDGLFAAELGFHRVGRGRIGALVRLLRARGPRRCWAP